MDRINVSNEPHTLTLGALCEALAEGNLQANVEDGFYTFTRRDLVRLADTVALREAIAAISERPKLHLVAQCAG